MEKIASRINWENEPSTNTPINEENLNKMDIEINTLDDRVILLDAKKANESDVLQLVSDVAFDENTGIITITKKNGSVVTIDTKMEKIAVNFEYDTVAQQIILTLVDGTKQYIDLSALITQYEFLDSDTVIFVVQTDGKIKAEIPDGSITENKLQPNYLAEIKVESANASLSATNAKTSETNSLAKTTLSESYAVGCTDTREGENTDNAKYYSDQAQKALESMQAAQVTGVKGDKEDKYRNGNVNLTAENIGAVAIGGDTAENTVAFTSTDATDPNEYTDVELLASGEKHSSLFSKMSTMFKNIRYLYKAHGTTDISEIGDGTVTGSIESMNSKLSELIDVIYPVGSIYMSVNNVSPATLFGGEWEQIKDTFLLSAGDSYSAGTTGGVKSTTLTSSHIPQHYHTVGAHSHGLNNHTHKENHRLNWVDNTPVGKAVLYDGWENGYPVKTKANPSQTSRAVVDYVTVNTGGASGNTANSAAFNSGNYGSASPTAINNMPPYLTVYVWKRTS